MYDGTLGTKGPWEALVTFQQMIILADKQGVVDKTPEAIARTTTIPLKIIQKGIAALEEPDRASRTPDEEGRRIVRLSDDRDWGWRIVNHGHYRKMRSADERREYMRQYMKDRRARVNPPVSELAAVNPEQPIAVSSKQYAVSNNNKRGFSKKGTTTRAMTLIAHIRKSRSPMHPTNALPEWQEGLSDSDVEVCKLFGITRILNDQNEGTVVAQLARALEEAAA